MALTYREAGVDVAKADHLLDGLKRLIQSTHGPEVLSDRGQFASLVRLPLGRFREPVLVSSTDGVGTKLQLATTTRDHVGIGIDVVAMNVNDIVVYGARPLFFLDYVAMGTLRPAIFRALVRGIAEGCRQSGCALVGGETAEMPGMHGGGGYDVAGFCVGVVERRRLVDGVDVRAEDVLVGLASSGLHANGFSLVRKALSSSALRTWKSQLLAPTRIYVNAVLAVLERVQVSAIVHVTGGGLARRIPNVVVKRPSLVTRLHRYSWPVPRIFQVIQQRGRISQDEMEATFNMGIGLAMTCRPRDVQTVIRLVRQHGIQAWIIGTVERR